MGTVLRRLREMRELSSPATADGGDILRLGRRIFIGVGRRTNLQAATQIRELVAPFGYGVAAVQVDGCLHLKSAATEVGPGTVLVNPAWIDTGVLGDVKCITVDPSEAYAANALRLGEMVLFPKAFPRTQRRLEAQGISVRTVAADELAKAEGALTCCSLILNL